MSNERVQDLHPIDQNNRSGSASYIKNSGEWAPWDGSTKNKVWDPVGLAWVSMAQTGVSPGGTVLLTQYAFRMYFDGSNNITHIAKASPGSIASAPVWQIRKMDYDGSGNMVSVKYAGGSDSFTNAADDYAILTYS